MEHIIWSNDYEYVKEIEDDLASDYPDYDEEHLFDLAYQTNQDYLEDEKVNLNKQLENRLLLIADLGLWYGHRTGYKMLNGSNLNDIFSGTVGDYQTWTVKDGDVKCRDIHHDGTNLYTYRMLKPGITEFEFEEEAFDGIKAAMEKYTEPLGHYIAEIYGWEDEE